jgi:NTP pyrophosphatase (non-canonical NTP hydrolase)
MNNRPADWIENVWDKQVILQEHLNKSVDLIDITKFYNSCTASMVEIGELLQSDTTWKLKITGSTKEPIVDTENVKKEFADVFLYLLNAAIYYGLNVHDLTKKITDVQNENLKRLINGNNS